MSPLRKIRVLIVDDSAVVRRCVSEALASDPEIEVSGTAADPYAARELIAKQAPDVLTLDLEMPRMDGLTFLRLLMQERPIPVIVLSSLTQEGSDYALEALRLGAVDVAAKPGPYSIGDLGPELAGKIKAVVGARPRPAASAARPAAPLPPSPGRFRDPRSLIVLGASTGGTEALREVLTHLPADLPGIAIVQHIPAMFSRNFADRLNQLSAIEVREAADGDRLEPGTALIAPGNFHLMLHWAGDAYVARVTGGPPIWHQRPAVDLLFKSALDAGAAPHCLAGVLTGMGRDGADGLLQLRRAGAATFAQDEATSVVFGMPRAAWENGATQNLLPLESIARYITGQCGTAACPTLRSA
jgi:two-component system chemotaxis response regulator CheB